MATISICIPCYKSERYIRTTIESVLAQTVAPAEFLISDDRSPDRSWEIVQEYDGLPGVRLMRPPRRMTLGEHYRFLLEQATSQYCCFLSSDDALMPDFVETMTKMAEGEDNLGLVSGACLETDSHLHTLRYRGAGTPKADLLPPAGFHYTKAGCVYTISFSLLSRSILLATPPIPVAGDLATDWCWSMLLGVSGKMKFVQKPMGYYRIHTTNAGHNNGEPWQDATVKMLEFLQSYLPAELGRELEPRLEVIRGQIARRTTGAPEQVRPNPLALRVKELAKSVIALRYRHIPAHLRRAEAGVSLTLEGRQAGRV